MMFIVHEYPPIVGGTGVLAQTVIEELSREIDAVIVTASETNRSRTEQKENCRVVRLGVPFRERKYHYATPLSLFVFVFRAAWHGWREGRRSRVRGIHAYHVFPAGLVAMILSRILKVPFFVTAIGAEIYDPTRDTGIHSKRLYREMMAAVMKRAAGLSAISTDIAGRARGYYDAGEIDILPPPLPPSMPPAERKAHEGFVLCSISRLARRKGLDITVRAIAKLGELPIRYVMVGDGNFRGYLTELARSLGIADRIEFRGFVDEAAKYGVLSESDLFVLPSHHEGFGICYLEAMSTGLPVIAGSSGGQTDFIVSGENGILLGELNEDELAGAIENLYRDPGLRETMSSNNRKKAASFLPSNIVKHYLSHYDRAAK